MGPKKDTTCTMEILKELMINNHKELSDKLETLANSIKKVENIATQAFAFLWICGRAV